MIEFLKFEMKVQCRQYSDLLLPTIFFIVTMIIMPFTIKPDAIFLHDLSIGLVWTSLILSAFLSTEKLFLNDIYDGTADRYINFPMPFEMIFLVKAIIFLGTRLIPLICVMPIMGLLFHLSLPEIYRLIVMLIIASPGLLFFSAFGALLSAGLRNSGLVVFILMLPLILPSIIFGAAGCNISNAFIDVYQLPLAFSLFSVILTTAFSGYLLKIICAER